MDTCMEVVRWLNDHTNSRNAEGMRCFGISGGRVLGISVADLRRYDGTLGRDHELAVSLWNTVIHEVRILASITAEPAQVGAAARNSSCCVPDLFSSATARWCNSPQTDAQRSISSISGSDSPPVCRRRSELC